MKINPAMRTKIKELARCDYSADSIVNMLKFFLPKAPLSQQIAAVKQIIREVQYA